MIKSTVSFRAGSASDVASDVGDSSLSSCVKGFNDAFAEKILWGVDKHGAEVTVFDYVYKSLNDFSDEAIFRTSKTGDRGADEGRLSRLFKARLKTEIKHCFDLEAMDWWSESSAEGRLRSAIKANALLAREAVSELYRDSVSNEANLLSLMVMLSHLSYAEVGVQAQIIAIAALSHKSIVIREAAIRMFEMWEDLDSIRLLKHHEVSPDWLMDYMLKVIEDFGV